jgi:cytochrome d ubiquinol oxidase subunit I
MAKRSIVVAAVFGLLASGLTLFTGDEHAYSNARYQPMKLAAFEGLYDGKKSADLVAFGILNPAKQPGDAQDPFTLEVKIPGLLSLLANRSPGSFVPGINDLVYGNQEEKVMGVAQMIEKGRAAVDSLASYKQAKKEGTTEAAAASLAVFNANKEYLGYGFLEKAEDAVPPVALTFYSFHIMVILGTLFPLVCLAYLFFIFKDTLLRQRWFLGLGTTMFFLSMIASQAGWVVAEVGRQPWAIQGLLPVTIARSNLTSGTVLTTFVLFLVLFTALLMAEVNIMMKQISIGPEEN